MSTVFDRECYPSKLEKDVKQFVEEIKTDLAKLTGKQFIGEVEVKKDLLEDNTSGYSYGDTSSTDPMSCSVCNVDCNKVFISESLTNLKYLSSYLHHTLNKEEHDREDTSKMGSSIVLKTVMDLFTNSVPYESSFALEVGGGGGAGFQVYCDDQKVLGAGGGGGGGLYYNFTASTTSDYAAYSSMFIDLGGGGGAGIQLYNKDDQTWRDFGGGGGCGGKSINTQGFPLAVTCGVDKDKHSLSTSELRQMLDQHFSHDEWKKCSSVRVEGGGGGGGGTGQCCAPFSLGFGFSFTLTSTEDVTTTRQLRSVQGDPGDGGDSSLSARLFSQSAVECSSARDNWCCICNTSKDYVSHCLNPRYKPWETFTNVTVSCDEVVDHQDSLQWMSQMDCCTYHNHSVYDRSGNANGKPFEAYSHPIDLAYRQSGSATRQLSSVTVPVTATDATTNAWSLYSYNPYSEETTQFISDVIYDVTLYSMERQQLSDALASEPDMTAVLKRSDTFMQCFNKVNAACMSTFNDTKYGLVMEQLASPVQGSLLTGPFLMMTGVILSLVLILKMVQGRKAAPTNGATTKSVQFRGEYETIVFTREDDNDNSGL